jgi:clan AA aspartic protease
MGLIRTKLLLKNPRKPDIAAMSVSSLVDTGALHLCIPEHLAIQLEFDKLENREVTTADGKKHLCAYVGPIEVRFENRACYTGALVLGDEVIFGAVPMEDMDVLISPAKQAVVVNPDSPNIPMSIVKGEIRK